MKQNEPKRGEYESPTVNLYYVATSMVFAQSTINESTTQSYDGEEAI